MHGPMNIKFNICSLLEVMTHPEVVVIVVLAPLWCKKKSRVLREEVRLKIINETWYCNSPL